MARYKGQAPKPGTGAATRFEKGHKKGGRPPGTPNKVTQASRELVIQAAANVGDPRGGNEGALKYLEGLARKKPSVFGAMFARTIDARVKGEADLRETVRIVNLTGLNLADPAVRKRLGPEILGRWPGEGGECD